MFKTQCYYLLIFSFFLKSQLYKVQKQRKNLLASRKDSKHEEKGTIKSYWSGLKWIDLI